MRLLADAFCRVVLKWILKKLCPGKVVHINGNDGRAEWPYVDSRVDCRAGEQLQTKTDRDKWANLGGEPWERQ